MTRTATWYVVCAFTTARTVAGEQVREPASIAHAKSVGGVVTACGLNVSTWTRLFDVPFPAKRAENCRACLDVVRPRG
jgi:hypothetical protein